MSCVSPFHVPKTDYYVPCGRCMQCRIAKQSQLTFLSQRELLTDVYPKGLGASFVTLTYNEDSVPFCNTSGMVRYSSILKNPKKFESKPYFMSLYKKDLQDFMKRVRRSMQYHNIDVPFRFLASGEFGDSTARPHYHLVFFGLSDVLARSVVRKNWPYGFIDVGPLSAGGLRYVCKYITKKYDSYNMYLHEKSLGVTSPFLTHSQRLGHNWILAHLDQIVDSDYTFIFNGSRCLYPKAVRDFVKYKTGVDPLPAIQKYLSADYASCPDDVDYEDFVRDRNILREQFLRSSAQSRGMTVTPEFLASRSWLRPRSVRFSPDFSSSALEFDDIPF